MLWSGLCSLEYNTPSEVLAIVHGKKKSEYCIRGGGEEYYANLELLRTFVDDALLFLACCIGCWI